MRKSEFQGKLGESYWISGQDYHCYGLTPEEAQGSADEWLGEGHIILGLVPVSWGDILLALIEAHEGGGRDELEFEIVEIIE